MIILNMCKSQKRVITRHVNVNKITTLGPVAPAERFQVELK